MNVWRYEEWAANLRMSRTTGTDPERHRLCIHTTEPTGHVPEPFHCDHIVGWLARTGTTGRNGTGVNTGARLRTGPVPVPNLWCEHGLTTVHRTQCYQAYDSVKGTLYNNKNTHHRRCIQFNVLCVGLCLASSVFIQSTQPSVT